MAHDHIPNAILDALEELQPGWAGIIGPDQAISQSVENQLGEYVPTVERLAFHNAPRFETSALVSRRQAAIGVPVLVTASG